LVYWLPVVDEVRTRIYALSREIAIPKVSPRTGNFNYAYEKVELIIDIGIIYRIISSGSVYGECRPYMLEKTERGCLTNE